jgi:hypothetical protein
MALDIKDDETLFLIRQLSKMTGETENATIKKAVRERLSRLRRQREQGLVQRMLAIGQDCASHLKEPFRSKKHGDLLYGKDGLPR